MKKTTLFGQFIFLLQFLFANIGFAADIYEPYNLDQGARFDLFKITGEIQSGDFDKFINYAISENKLPGAIIIESPGGNVGEALKFGRFANHMFMSCHAEKQCNSSCFLIIAGCVDRSLSIDVGIHRPFFNPDDFGKLPFGNAQSKYNRLLRDVEVYLNEMGTPKHLIDDMISVPSDEPKFISYGHMEETIGKRKPAYHEWLIAKCGIIPNNEKADLETVSNADLYAAVRDYYQTHELDDDGRKALEYTRSYFLKAQSMSEGYKSYLKKREEKRRTCEAEAVDELRKERWTQWKSKFKGAVEK